MINTLRYKINGLRKPVLELTDMERHWIKLLKGHYNDKYPKSGEWYESILPFYKEHWTHINDKTSINNIIFNLYEVYNKIELNKSRQNRIHLDMVQAALGDKIFMPIEKDPLKRVLSKIASAIQLTAVYTKDKRKLFTL